MIPFRFLPLSKKLHVLWLATKILVLGFFLGGCACPVDPVPAPAAFTCDANGVSYTCDDSSSWVWVDETKVSDPPAVVWMACTITPRKVGYVCMAPDGSLGTVAN